MLKEEIISKFEENFDEENRTIDELEVKIPIQANKIDQLMIKYDDSEQYSRHSCLKIDGIGCRDDERNDDVLQRVKECYEEMNLPFQNENNDRVHRIGKTYTDENIDRVHRIEKTYTDKNTGKKILENLVNIFMMQERSITPIINGNQVNIYLVYRLISQEGNIYYLIKSRSSK